MKRVGLICAGIGVVPWLWLGQTAADKNKVDFARDVLPVFKAHCFSCHGPDVQSAGLRLDQASFDKVIVKGDSRKSLLLQRILGQGGPRMPMGFNPLSNSDIATIERWIDEGATIGEGNRGRHWAYEAPVAIQVPKITGSWGQHPIDAFIREKLDRLHLKPSPVAAKATLLRRVFLDLTGLPPTYEEAEQYLNDGQAGAYERLVDRLLASKQYGERFAGPWLDLARYADTNGYEADRTRVNWPYRDWVVDAFNQDMTFDEFTIEQLAGDLLPNASKDQLIATGFHRNTMFNEEGGVDRGEQRWLTLVDRVGTTGYVWLGSTLACAQCHNHKYDPFSQEDFYRMLAFWESTDEPTLDLSDPRVHEIQDQVGKLEQALPKLKGDEEATKAAQAAIQSLRAKADEMGSVSCLILREKSGQYPPKTPIRIKGSYLSPSKVVEAGIPQVLGKLSSDQPQNRLGLARWLVNRQNPLTARVYVNRIWAQLFGVGLVKTEEDFGTQGERPTYQQLLDWLAVEFMEKGWSTKRLVRVIVTSNTYKQDSSLSKELQEKDPENRLLARGPRFRLSAESIRDNALAISGLLSKRMGGPSVMPDQPDGIWDSPYSGEAWNPSSGENRYRRGLYTFWKRTAPYPSFMSFDAVSRESCTVRRIRTNTPLQSLVLLNDPVYLSAARGLAARMLAWDGKNGDDKVMFGFRLALTRRPQPAERMLLTNAIEKLEKTYAKDHGAAQKLLGGDKPLEGSQSVEQSAAYILAAQMILNLDETISKE